VLLDGSAEPEPARVGTRAGPRLGALVPMPVARWLPLAGEAGAGRWTGRAVLAPPVEAGGLDPDD